MDMVAEAETWLPATSKEKQQKQRSIPLVREEEGAEQPWEQQQEAEKACCLFPGVRCREISSPARQEAVPVLRHGGQQPGSGGLGSAPLMRDHPVNGEKGGCCLQSLELLP